jgi:hypothetical protein
MNCRPGDLAISINTRWPENIGLIVRVVRRHVDTPAWNFRGEPTWWCVCGQPMTWHFLPTTRVVKAHEGPVPVVCNVRCLFSTSSGQVLSRRIAQILAKGSHIRAQSGWTADSRDLTHMLRWMGQYPT